MRGKGEANDHFVNKKRNVSIIFIPYQRHELLGSNDGSGDVGIDGLAPEIQFNLLDSTNRARVLVDNHSRKTEKRRVGLAMMTTLGFRFADRLEGVLGVDEAYVGGGGGELFLVDD